MPLNEDPPVLSIVIVSYYVREFLEQCLDSIRNSSPPAGLEIIVVDNNSKDGTAEMVQTRFPDVLLLENETNPGFGAACNQGLARARGKYILFLNPDTLVQPATLQRGVAYLDEQADVGLISCKVLRADGALELGCRRSFPTPATALYRLTGLSKLFPRNKKFGSYNLTYLEEDGVHDVDAVSGSYMMARTAPVRELNGFDPDFFMFGEDLDLCYRLKKRGWRIQYVPNASIIHFRGRSSRSNTLVSRLAFYNAMFIFSRKHVLQHLGFIPRGVLFLGIFVNALFKIILGFFQQFLVYIIDFLILNETLFLCLFYRFRLAGQVSPYEGGWLSVGAQHVLFSMIFILNYYINGLYKRHRHPFYNYIKSSVLSSFIFLGITYIWPPFAFSRLAFVAACAGATLLLPAWRLLLRADRTDYYSTIRFTKKTALVGDYATLRQMPYRKWLMETAMVKCIGLISLQETADSLPDIPYLGRLEHFETVVRRYRLHEVIVLPEGAAGIDLANLIKTCQKNGVDIKLAQKQMQGSRPAWNLIELNIKS
jgi:GT2 family glycosyltransferase